MRKWARNSPLPAMTPRVLLSRRSKHPAAIKQRSKENLSQMSFNGPRGPMEIDAATNNVVQNIYIFKNEFKDGKVVANGPGHG